MPSRRDMKCKNHFHLRIFLATLRTYEVGWRIGRTRDTSSPTCSVTSPVARWPRERGDGWTKNGGKPQRKNDDPGEGI